MLVQVNNKKTHKLTTMQLDETLYLDAIRVKLTSRNIIDDETYFMYGNSCVFKEDESTIRLRDLLEKDETLILAENSLIDMEIDASDFSDLTNDEIMNFFTRKQLFRGIVFSESRGINKSFSDVFTMTAVPKILSEMQNMNYYSYYSFSKESSDLSFITSNKKSISLKTPFVDAESEYNEKKSSKSHSEFVTEYLSSKLVISLMSFKIAPENCRPTPEFVRDINDIVTQDIERERKALLILKVLDEYGLYIPTEFTMGGALCATQNKEVQELSDAKSTEQEFSANAQAAFNGYGGGVSYGNSEEADTSHSSTQKSEVITITQIGGEPGTALSKELFASSIKSLSDWAIADMSDFYPTLLLLKNVEPTEEITKNLFAKVSHILKDYYFDSFLITHQPYVDMQKYIDEISARTALI